MTEQTALTIPERAALALNSSKVTEELHALVASSADITAVIDSAGREQAHRIGMNLKNARIAIEKTGKSAREDAQAFSKGVIAEEARLKAIIEPEEGRVFALRDGFDAKIEAEKQAKLAVERERVEAIQSSIDQFGKMVLQAAGKGSQEIGILRAELTRSVPCEMVYEEFLERAEAAYDEACLAMGLAYNAAYDAEQAAEAARIQREEEDRQRAAEAAENARRKAELDAQAAAQAAEAKRIAEAQAAEQKRLNDIAAAQRSEIERQQREAQAAIDSAAAEQAKIQKAAADAHAAEMKRQADEMHRMQAEMQKQRAAFEAEQAAMKASADAEVEKQRKAEADAKAEQERQADEEKRVEEEKATRERDNAHKVEIENQVVKSLVEKCAIHDGVANLIVNAICLGEIHNVSIAY